MRVELKPITSYDYHSLRQLPMFVGLLAPLCVLLSIPPISGSWSSDEFISNIRDFQDNSTILTLLSIGIICLLFGNLALLFRFLERWVIISTLCSVFGYFMNFALTLAAILYFRFTFVIENGKKLSGEYYAAYASCAISFTISLFLVVDFFRNNHLRGRGSGLSKQQRVLVFMALVVAIWAVLGALVYGKLQGWTFTRGIYFVLVTSTTIGFGDFVPKTSASQAFNIFYASIGIIMMGMFIAFIRSVILEYFQNKYYLKLENMADSKLDNLAHSDFRTSMDEKQLNALNLTADKLHGKTSEEHEMELQNAQFKQYVRQLRFSTLAMVIFWLLGAALFSWVEEWDYFKAFYFCFISFTTIGYGDISVTSFPGTVIFCVYVLVGLATMAYFISVATELFSFVIDRNSDIVETKRKILTGCNENLRPNDLDSPIGDPKRNFALVEALELDTGNEKEDLIQKLLSMTEFYHKEVQHFVKSLSDANDLYNGNKDPKNSALLQKFQKYDKLYTQLIQVSQSKLNATNNCNIRIEIESPPAVFKSPGIQHSEPRTIPQIRQGPTVQLYKTYITPPS